GVQDADSGAGEGPTGLHPLLGKEIRASKIRVLALVARKAGSPKNESENRCRIEKEVPADGARVPDGARGGGSIACGPARRDEGARDGDSEIAVPARGAGVAASRSDAQGVQGARKRSGEVTRVCGWPAGERGWGKRICEGYSRGWSETSCLE